MKLEKCPDKNAQLKFKFELVLLKEIDIDTISQMTKLNDSFEDDIKSVDMQSITNMGGDDSA